MVHEIRISRGASILVGAASLVVLIGAMQVAQAIVVPILLALFLALIGTPALMWLCARGLPNGLAVLIVVVGMLAVILLAGVLLGGSVAEFSSRVPYYEHRLQDLTNTVLARFGAGDELVTIRGLLKEVDPGAAWGLATSLLNSLSGLFGNATLIVFTMVFILLEAGVLPDKIAAAAGRSSQSTLHLNRFIKNLNRYLRIKTTTSAITGISVWLWLSFLGVDFALLWGLLAFLLNFIPTIGSIIAAIPAVLLALVQHGPAIALITAAGYMVVNILIGNLIEPRILGYGLGLSTLVVFLSLIFWGWVLGPVGMLLSVPLTMTVKIALESSSETRRYAILLSADVPDVPTAREPAIPPTAETAVDSPPSKPDDITPKPA